MSGLPAVVTILGLGSGTLSSSAVFPASQTTNGVATTLGFTLTQIMTTAFGGLPTGGATAAVLQKSSGADYATSWGAVNLATSAAVTGVLPVPNGGSGTATLTAFGVPYGTGTSALGVTSAGTTGWPLVGNGTAVAPSFAVLGVVGGGSGTASLTAFGALYGNGTATIGVTAAGTSGWPLIGNGASLAPSFAVLGVPGGGTNTATLTSNAVLLGAGTATLQFAAPSTAGNLLIDQGSTTNPAFKTVALDLTLSSAGTATVVGLYGRTLLSTAPTTSQVLQWGGATWAPANAVTNVSTGWGLAGGAITTSGTLSVATTNPPYGFGPVVNLQLSASTSGSALTIAVKANDGTNPSATNPVLFHFHSATAANGDPVWRVATAALSITINQTATLGAAAGSPMRGWITAHDTGTTPTLGVINCLIGMPTPTQVVALAPHTLQTTTAIATTAVTAGVFYSGVAVSNKPFCILGYFEYTNMTTAGQWINTPTTMQLFGPSIKKPGDIVQSVYNFGTTTGTTGTTTLTASVVSASLTPTSMANVVMAQGDGLGATQVVTSNLWTALRRGASTNIGATNVMGGSGSPIQNTNIHLFGLDAPATTGAQPYTVFFASSGTGTVTFPNSTFAGNTWAVLLQELMA